MDPPLDFHHRRDLISELLVEAAAMMEDASATLVSTLPKSAEGVTARILLARRTGRRVTRLARAAAALVGPAETL